MSHNKPSPQMLAIQLQQRQILTMMGVDVWVQHDSATLVVDFDLEQSPLISATSSAPVSDASDSKTEIENRQEVQSKTIDSHNHNNDSHNHKKYNHNNIGENQPNNSIGHPSDTQPVNLPAVKPLANNPQDKQESTIQSPAQEQKVSKHIQQPVAPQATVSQVTVSQANRSQQVASFDLLGARYHGWVFLVDGKHLADAKLAKLWQNMSHALSLVPEHLQFPICEGMHDKESADASVAGFVFRLGGLNPAKVASLTPLPEGLDYDSLIRVPYLMEMLEDSRQKKQFWQLISETN